MAGNAVARTAPVQSGPVSTALMLPEKQSTMLAQARAQIEPYLPRGVQFEAVISDVFLATKKNPDLLECDPESLVLAVVEVQQRGLRVGSTCHLVPKGGKVLAWNDYRGDIEMIVASGACRDVQAFVVYEKEQFVYRETLDGPELSHEIILHAKSRGEIVGAYAKYLVAGGRWRVKYMPVDDIEKIRKNSLTWSPTSKRPVVKCPDWYAIKTVIRQGAKLLPKNRALLQVYATFDREERETDGVESLGAGPTLVRDDDGTPRPVDTATGELVGANVGAPALTIEQARAYPFPFRPGTKIHNRPLGDVSTDTLNSVANWIVEQQDAKGDQAWHADTLDAINLVIESRGAEATAVEPEADQPPVDEAELIAETPRGAPAGSLSMKMPPGGPIEGALELNDLRQKTNTNAQMD
jgi:phage RecT family recombinase